jgi:hypothetical protein
MIKVYIGNAELFAMDQAPIFITMEWAGDLNTPPSRRVLHYHPPAPGEDQNATWFTSWDEVEPDGAASPTILLSEEAARALLDALVRRYEGASDMHTVRSDLLHERGRVDKLTEAVCGLAKTLAAPPAEQVRVQEVPR